MPSAVVPNPRAGAQDEANDLFNYDAGLEEALNGPVSAANRPATSTNPLPDFDTNLDEEVKVTKKRKIAAKLDEERLMSAAGVPKLRKISKSMKFKGKGHEFSDMARLLNTYQLWLDDLFPKAKFADGLAMIEKVGHKKQMQMMRKQWIDESKPRPVDEPDEVDMAGHSPVEEASNAESGSRNGEAGRLLPSDQVESDEQGDHAQSADQAAELHAGGQPEEDELDALLAESAPVPAMRTSLFGSGVSQQPNAPVPPDRSLFEDEEEAMAGMDW